MGDEYYRKTKEDVLRELKTSQEKGLPDDEAKKRLEEYGLNELEEKEDISPFRIFIAQFQSFIVYILLAALLISAVLGEYIDALVIAIILILNAILGFIQEYRAEKAIEALKKMASLKAIVIRGGIEKKVDSSEVVPGDILVLDTGIKVPADARIIECINLEMQEAALTGESTPVTKNDRQIMKSVGVADMANMIFSGTIITKGRGKAVVISTGMDSEIGKIAEMIQAAPAMATPLQKKLRGLGETLGIATIVICALVFFVGISTGKPVLEMFRNAVSLAVAAIPEGLPAVVTVSLALGVQRMVKRNALIRKLPSVESLGAVTVICSDKTGTLTHNEMTVRKVYANRKIIGITGEGYKKEGLFSHNGRVMPPKDIELLLKIGALCNDAKISDNSVIGDPTEAALLVSAAKAKIGYEDLQKKYPRIDELQFDSKRKMMSTFHRIKGKKTVMTKGAPDRIVEICDMIYENGHIRRFTRQDRKEILKMNELFAKQALRVLGFAYKESGNLEENNLVFVGLQAMIDPPRKECRDAIAKCEKAGIKVIMITGDHMLTAQAVGGELGLKGKAIDGAELEKMKDLEEDINGISIVARADPKHKVRIVEALRKKGHIIAMTGDGVNDAPALKKADIGIAMGISGTDVAKEASEMILSDDNFASIVNAVEEGRGVYDNIKKFVEYLLSSNLGEILTIFIAIIIGLPLPILALQILWINLLTDGPPALALGIDPADPNLMERKPRDPKERVISRGIITRMIFVGIIMMTSTLGIFYYYLTKLGWSWGMEISLREMPYFYSYSITVAFTTLMMLQMFNVLNCRSEQHSLFKVGVFKNMWLIMAVLASIGMQVLVIHTPLSTYFRTVPLALADWGLIILVSSSVFVFVEIWKLFKREEVVQAA